MKIQQDEGAPANTALRDRLSNISHTLKAVDDLANWQAMQNEVSLLQKDLEVREHIALKAASVHVLLRMKKHGMTLRVPRRFKPV